MKRLLMRKIRADLPRFGKWHTVYMRMRRWADAGILDRLFGALQEHHMIRVSIDCLGLDSTSIKVQPDGTGAPKKRVAIDWKITRWLEHQSPPDRRK